MDLEFGQVYGSYRRDFVPTEIGFLIHRSSDDNIAIRGKRFDLDGFLVMRSNSLDSLGNSIGLEEKVINPSQASKIEYDPRYRIGRIARGEMELKIAAIFHNLGKFMDGVVEEHSLDRIVFFGGQEDLNLLKRGKASITNTNVLDLQKDIRVDLGQDLSLDKASMIIGYGFDDRQIFSEHYKYHVPERFKHLLDPHKAVGDVARMFLLSKELIGYKKTFLKNARRHIRKIQKYKDDGEEIPIF